MGGWRFFGRGPGAGALMLGVGFVPGTRRREQFDKEDIFGRRD